MLPVVVVRPLDARVGNTLLVRLLATSHEIVIEQGYAEGERRYLSYCLRIARTISTPWDPAVHPDVTDLLFGPDDRTGPIPFLPRLVDVGRLAPQVLNGLWDAVSGQLQEQAPGAATTPRNSSATPVCCSTRGFRFA